MAPKKKIKQTKKSVLARVIKIILGILTTLGLGLLMLLYWGMTHRDIVFGEIAYKNSDAYNFSQNPITRWITISKQGKKLYQFYFYPKVFAAWVNNTKPYILLITSDTGTLKGAQGLYVYNGNIVKKVFQAGNVKFENGKTSPGRIYVPWISPNADPKGLETELKEVKTRMNNVFSLSPDGRYLFGYESGYEGGRGFTIDLNTVTHISLQLDNSERLWWSPDKKCAVNFAYDYGDSASVQLLAYQNENLVSKAVGKSFSSSTLKDVYWGESCEGVVTIYSNYDAQGNEHQQTTLYKFSFDQGSLAPIFLPINELQSHYRQSATIPQSLQNIYFILEKPLR